nr:hypothetical protein [Tanacetum cinerariifolium]
MDLFGSTFVKSLNKKSYCLVVTDDYNSLKVKVIKSDNGTEFKNNDLNQFCRIKGIKREFSVPITPQQNGIAERKTRTLIEAARTMLADLFLPIPFWAEAVNTAYYVQNRVLVTKPHNKTPYELLHSRTLKNKPNIAGSGPTWLFDIDSLTRTMNYQPVTAGNQTNPSAGFQDKLDAEKAGEEIDQQYEPDFDVKKPESKVNVSSSSSAQSRKQDDKTKKETKGKSRVDSFTGYRDLSVEFEDCFDNSINEVNAAGTIVPTIRQNSLNNTNTFSAAGPSNAAASPTYGQSLFINASQLPGDLDMLELKDITHSDDENDVGAEADFNNLETSITEEVYVCQPLGFEDPAHLDKVYKVVKELYGLHQAPRAWTCVNLFEKLMKDKFQMSSMGELTFFLGLQVKQKKDGIFISQDKYVAEILREFGLTEGKSASTPIDTEKPLLKDPDCEDVDVHTYSDSPLLGVNTPRSDEDRLELMELMVFLFPKVEKVRIGVNVVDLQVSPIRHKLLLFSLTNWCCSLSAVSSSIKQVNDVTRLQALVDKKKVVITEATIREALCFNDAEGMLVEQQGDEEGDADENVEVNVGDTAEGDDCVAHGDVSAAYEEIPTVTEEPSIPSPTPPTLPPQPPQDIPLTSKDVKKLERRNKVRVLKLRRLQKGRMIAKMDQDNVVVLEDDKKEDKEVADAIKDVEEAKIDESAQDQGRQAESQAKIYKIDMDHAKKVLSMQEDKTKPTEVQEVVDVVTTTKLITEVVTAASETVTAASEIVTATSVIITTAEVQVPAATLTAAPARVVAALSRRRKGIVIKDPKVESTTSTIIPAETKSKDKGKGILVEEPKPLKKKQQIKQDEQYAKELHAELNKDIDWDEAIDHVKRKAKEDPAVKKYQAMKRKPWTEAQARKNMMMYLKNTKEQIEEDENRALQKLNETPAERVAMRRKLDEEVEKLKRHFQIVLNEDDDVYTEATPLAQSIIKFTSTQLILLVERKYPLTRFTLDQRLNAVRLKVEEESEISGALTDEAVRNGSIKKVEKRENVGEPSKDKNGRDDNKRTRLEMLLLLSQTLGVPRNVNPINASNPTVRACYECGSTDYAREFMLGAEEARQDPNIMTGIEPSKLGFRYEIEIASGQLVEIDKIIKRCKLEIKGHVLDIDLIPFGHGSFDVIIGMGWLSNHKAEIICYEKIVRIPLLDGKVLRVLGERQEEKVRLLVSDKTQEEIVVVRDFLEVFLDDLSGLSPVQEIEFRIELNPRDVPIAKSPYRLAPSELEELSGYYQLRVHENDIPKIAFRTRYGYFEFTVMPFGLGRSMRTLKVSLGLLKKEKLYAKFSKCEFWLIEVQFLRHVINGNGIHVDPSKIEVVKNWKTLRTPSETLEDKLCNASFLTLPDEPEDFLVYCDASEIRLGCVLMQIELFSDYDYEIRYHLGKANVVADALSRKERVKPKRVRAMNMTLQSSIKDRILTAQKKAVDESIGLHKVNARGIRNSFRHEYGLSPSDQWSDVSCASFKALYGRKCHSPIMWAEVGEGVVRFGKKGKLAPRFVRPFEIVEKVGHVAYRLDLPEKS